MSKTEGGAYLTYFGHKFGLAWILDSFRKVITNQVQVMIYDDSSKWVQAEVDIGVIISWASRTKTLVR